MDHSHTDVLQLLTEGATNKEIAERLFVSPSRVAQRLQEIADKAGIEGGWGLRSRVLNWYLDEYLARGAHDQHSAKGAVESTQQRAAGRQESWNVSQRLIEWLASVYEPLAKPHGRIVRQGPYTYPAVFFPANGQPIEEVLPIENIDFQVISKDRWGNSTGVSDARLKLNPTPRRRRHGLPDDATRDEEWDTVDGQNLCMTALSFTDERPTLAACVGTYGQIMDSSDAMIDEIVAIPEDRLRAEYTDQVLQGLEMRSWAHQDTVPFLTAQHRAAGIGVAALVCYRSFGDIFALVARRSTSVSTWKRAMHVFPSGMLGKRSAEFVYEPQDVLRAMLFEFAEELMNRAGFDQRSMHPARADWVHRQWLGEATIKMTGIAFDLLNLRPEICALIMINDPSWIELIELDPGIEVDSGGFHHLRVGSSDEMGLEQLKPSDTVPTGAAAFWEGVNLARTIGQ